MALSARRHAHVLGHMGVSKSLKKGTYNWVGGKDHVRESLGDYGVLDRIFKVRRQWF